MENRPEIDMARHQDFALKSGERQVATTMEGIRYDHRCRYRLAVDFLREYAPGKPIRILDCFCGNGYGTCLLAQNLQEAEVEGIDGSAEAVALANECYKLSNTSFSARIFPFELPQESYDAVVSLESIEHVEDDVLFLKTLVSSLKPGGFLFLTVPNEDVINFERNKARYKFHYRHYRYGDLLGMAHENDLFMLAYWGQNYYRMSKEGKPEGDLPAEETVPFKSHDGQALIFLFQKSPVEARLAAVRAEALIEELRGCYEELRGCYEELRGCYKEQEQLLGQIDGMQNESELLRIRVRRFQEQRDCALKNSDRLRLELADAKAELKVVKSNLICRTGICLQQTGQKIKNLFKKKG